MTTALPREKLETLVPLLAGIARLVARTGTLAQAQLEVLIMGVGLEPAPDSIQELDRWAKLLERARTFHDDALQHSVVEALLLRGVPEAAAVLAVEAVVPKQPHVIHVAPDHIDFGTLPAHTASSRQVQVMGGPGEVVVENDHIRAVPPSFGKDPTVVTITVRPLTHGVLWSAVRFQTRAGAVAVPVSAQWEPSVQVEHPPGGQEQQAGGVHVSTEGPSTSQPSSTHQSPNRDGPGGTEAGMTGIRATPSSQSRARKPLTATELPVSWEVDVDGCTSVEALSTDFLRLDGPEWRTGIVDTRSGEFRLHPRSYPSPTGINPQSAVQQDVLYVVRRDHGVGPPPLPTIFLTEDERASAKQRDNNLEAVNLNDGQRLWLSTLQGVKGEPMIFGADSDELFVCTHGKSRPFRSSPLDHRLVAVERSSGKKMWETGFRLPEPHPIRHVDLSGTALRLFRVKQIESEKTAILGHTTGAAAIMLRNCGTFRSPVMWSTCVKGIPVNIRWYDQVVENSLLLFTHDAKDDDRFSGFSVHGIDLRSGIIIWSIRASDALPMPYELLDIPLNQTSSPSGFSLSAAYDCVHMVADGLLLSLQGQMVMIDAATGKPQWEKRAWQRTAGVPNDARVQSAFSAGGRLVVTWFAGGSGKKLVLGLIVLDRTSGAPLGLWPEVGLDSSYVESSKRSALRCEPATGGRYWVATPNMLGLLSSSAALESLHHHDGPIDIYNDLVLNENAAYCLVKGRSSTLRALSATT